MLDALTEDFRSIKGVEVEVLDNIPTRIDADWTLVIAPETGGILESVARQVLRAGGRLLGPSPEAIRLTSDKLMLAEHLRASRVATPETVVITASPPEGCAGIPATLRWVWSTPSGCNTWLGSHPNGLPQPLTEIDPIVLKPRDGAGSQDTFLIRDPSELEKILPTLSGEMIVQPFIAGRAASVAFLIGPHDVMPLLPCGQELSDDGRFHYRGGSIPLAVELANRGTELARCAIVAVRGLLGYVGVDLVLEQEDVVIEINPRLTTSYLGLRAACRENLAEAMLRMAEGETVELTWDQTPRRFEIGPSD